jgi:alpha-tubulin suppressor-like RCC1 family protein
MRNLIVLVAIVALAIAAHAQHLAIVANNQLYTLGINFEGQIGNNNTDQQFDPYSVPGVTLQALNGANSRIATGTNSTFYSNGTSVFFTGRTGANFSTLVFQPGPSFSSILSMAVGPDHFAVVINSGDIYSWGSNAFGKLGQGSSSLYQATPVKASYSQVARKGRICAGLNHLAFVDVNQKVSAAGLNDRGQVGTSTASGNAFVNANPTSGGPSADMIACGANFTVVIDSSGSIWGTGDNSLRKYNFCISCKIFSSTEHKWFYRNY